MAIHANYHTHTERCLHATGRVIDYVQEAERAGLRRLGMSDHAPFPDRRWSHVRMQIEEIDDYLQEVSDARCQFPGMEILASFEAEYVPEFADHIRDNLLGRPEVDYLVQGEHYIAYDDGQWLSVYGLEWTSALLKRYAGQIIVGMESGLFAFLAHPDVFANVPIRWNANFQSASCEILEAAEKLAMPIEINAYGLRKTFVQDPGEAPERPPYPYLPFWELAAEYNVRVVFSSDAHEPESVAAGLEDVAAIARRFGLQPASEGFIRPRERCVSVNRPVVK